MVFQDFEGSFVKAVIAACLPGWQKELFKMNSEAIQVHSHGQLFYKLNTLFPNEHPSSKHHRVLAFESITEASYGRAANNVNRIFKNSSYTVQASEGTLAYLGQDDFGGHTFYDWFLNEWVSWALKEDPNARIVVYPPAYFRETSRPVGFVASEHLKHEDEDTVIFISEEESVVEYQLDEVAIRSDLFYDQSIGRPNINLDSSAKRTYMPKIRTNIKQPVYHVFQKNVGFFRIYQDRQQAGFYKMDRWDIPPDFIPVIDVGGQTNKLNINKSFLHPFVNFGNLALLQHSQHTAVNLIYSFPRMSEVETPCEAVGCKNGFILVDDDPDWPEGRKPCQSCHGSGFTTNQTPYKVYRKRYDPNGMGAESEKFLETPDVQYYTPPTDVLAYSKQEWKDYLDMAETAVYIQQRVQTGNVQAAKSKEIDREDLYAFLSMVGQTYFTRLRYVIQCFENYLNRNPAQVNVNIPFSYAILSEEEAFDALNKILSADIPVMLKANQIESFIGKFVSQASPIKKFINVLKEVDPLVYYSAAELTNFKISGVVSTEQYATHVYAFPILQQLYQADKNLFEQDTSAIAAKLTEALKPFIPKPTNIKTALTGNQPPATQ